MGKHITPQKLSLHKELPFSINSTLFF